MAQRVARTTIAQRELLGRLLRASCARAKDRALGCRELGDGRRRGKHEREEGVDVSHICAAKTLSQRAPRTEANDCDRAAVRHLATKSEVANTDASVSLNVSFEKPIEVPSLEEMPLSRREIVLGPRERGCNALQKHLYIKKRHELEKENSTWRGTRVRVTVRVSVRVRVGPEHIRVVVLNR
jgi:hypothetical protein